MDFVNKLTTFLFSICCVICVTFLAPAAWADQPAYGGTLVWGTVNPPTIINPILTQQGVSAALMGLIFDSLVRVDAKHNIVPGLASSWDISSDGLVYTFYLRKGVRFHDGVEFTAQDVKFTYEAIADPVNKSPRRVEREVAARWEMVDRYTIKLVLQQKDKEALRWLVREIVPEHLLKGKDLASAAFNYAPVGTGAFRFKHWDRTLNQVELEANPDYFDGRPYLNRVLVKMYPDNKRLWAALMRREVDLVKYLNQEDYDVLRQDKTFRTYQMPMNATYAIVYDLAGSIVSDINVRRAIALAIDIKKILRDTSTSGIQSTGPFQLNSPGFDASIVPLPYDPLKAKSILYAAGWTELDSEGVLKKAGQKFEITMLVNSRSEYFQKIAMMIRQQLSEVGIRIKVLLYRDESEITPEYWERYKPQARLMFFFNRASDAKATLGRWYPSTGMFDRLLHYKSAGLDRLLGVIAREDNVSRQEQIYREIHRIIYADQPACFLFSPVMLHAVNALFGNTDDFFSASMPLYTIKNWYVGR